MKTPSSKDPQAQAESFADVDAFVEAATRLSEHWLFSMQCDHETKTDRANCNCGWSGEWQPCVGDAAEEWAAHALLKIGWANRELLDALKAISEIELAEGPGLSTWKDFAGKCIDIARAAIAKVQP